MYCFTCGRADSDLDLAAMCGPCRRAWRPAVAASGDLGLRSPPVDG